MLAGLLLTCLLVYDLGGRELWTDEEFSLVAQAPLQHAAFGDASHPPGYAVLLHYWLRLSPQVEQGRSTPGPSDGWLRAFSIPWALLTWLLGWLIAARLNLRREGIIAAWLMAISPLVLTYFRLGRYYSMSAALTMLCLYAMLQMLQRPTAWRAALLALTVAAIGYTDYMGLQVCLAALALFGTWAITRREYRALAGLWGGAAVAAVLLVPLALMLKWNAARVALIPADPLSGSLWGLGVKLALPVFSLATSECVDPWRFGIVIPALLVTVVLLVAGLVKAHRQGGEAAMMVWLWPVNIVIAALMMSSVAANVPPNRVTSFAMFTIPLAYLLLALGLASLKRPLAVVGLVVLVLVSLYGTSNYFRREQLLNPGFAPPWREVAALIEEREQPGDRVLAIENAFVRYYNGNSFLGREEQIHELLAGSLAFQRRTWLITRDRGSQEMAGYGLQLREKLLSQGATEQVFNIMPRSPQEQKMLAMVLRRPAWDAYVKVYLFTPRA